MPAFLSRSYRCAQTNLHTVRTQCFHICLNTPKYTSGHGGIRPTDIFLEFDYFYNLPSSALSNWLLPADLLEDSLTHWVETNWYQSVWQLQVSVPWRAFIKRWPSLCNKKKPPPVPTQWGSQSSPSHSVIVYSLAPNKYRKHISSHIGHIFAMFTHEGAGREEKAHQKCFFYVWLRVEILVLPNSFEFR